MNDKDLDRSTSSITDMPAELTNNSGATYQARTGSINSSSPPKHTAARSTVVGEGGGGTDTADVAEPTSAGHRREHSADDATHFEELEHDRTGKEVEISTPPAMERNLFLSALANGKFAVREA